VHIWCRTHDHNLLEHAIINDALSVELLIMRLVCHYLLQPLYIPPPNKLCMDPDK
jgi:hypothetical protein